MSYANTQKDSPPYDYFQVPSELTSPTLNLHNSFELPSDTNSFQPSKNTPTPEIPENPTSSSRELKCYFCSKSFVRATSYKRHLDSHRRGPQCHPCWHCPKGFSRKGVLVRHVKEVHEYVEKDRIDCGKCAKSFKFKTSLANHLKIHSAQSFKCSECGKVFKCERYLKTHMQRHSSSMHACKVCGKLFAAHVDVLKHYKVHREQFRCKACEVVFKTVAERIIHFCSKGDPKRQFRVSDEMASGFVSQVRQCIAHGDRLTLDEAILLMRKSIPPHLCTEHILLGLCARFNLKFKGMRRRITAPPPPPPPLKEMPPKGAPLVPPDSLAHFPSNSTSVAIPKNALPKSSRVHWYLTTTNQLAHTPQVESRLQAAECAVKEAAETGCDFVDLSFSAGGEAGLMVAVSKAMEDKGFRCWNFREMAGGEEGAFFSLHIEWGHLAASH